MVVLALKVLLGAILVSNSLSAISVSRAVYEQGRKYYQQGLAEYRKSSNKRNVTLACIRLLEACERTNYTIPTFVHDYAYALRSAEEHMDADVVVTVLEHGIVAQLDLVEQVTTTNATSYNSLLFDHKHEISLYAVHLIDFYDVIHEHTGLGWEELGFVVR